MDRAGGVPEILAGALRRSLAALGQIARAPQQRRDGLRLLQPQRDRRVDALGQVHQRQADDLRRPRATSLDRDRP